MLVRTADGCFRHRRLVVAGWVAALVGAFLLAGAFGGEFRQDYLQPGSESKAVSNTLDDRFPQGRATPSRSSSTPIRRDPPEVRAAWETILAEVADAQHVVSVVSPSARGRHQISADGTTAYADRRPGQDGRRVHPRRPRRWSRPILAAADDALQVEVGGPVATKCRRPRPRDPKGIGLIAAAIILLITFGSAVAMGLPLLTALFGLGIAMALGEVLRRFVDVPTGRRTPRRWSASASASTTPC